MGETDNVKVENPHSARLLIDARPIRPSSPEEIRVGDSLSPVAPFRIVNIGNSEKVLLLDFIEAIESELGKKADRHFMPMQKGDVPRTYASSQLLHALTGFMPAVSVEQGVRAFVEWYRAEIFNKVAETAVSEN